MTAPPCAATVVHCSAFSARAVQKTKGWLRHRDGHRAPVSIRAAPYADPVSGLAGVVEVFHDNTEGIALLQRATEMERLAYIDPLTQTGIRRFAEQVLQQCWDSWSRNQSAFGIAMLDIEHFKAVNDRHGHDAGDEVLRVVCRPVASSLRSFDFIGRWGGEEFLAIIQCVRQAELARVTRRFLNLVRTTSCNWGNQRIQVTTSIGIASVEECGSAGEMLLRADQRLYAAKSGGRNRLIGPETLCANGATSPPTPPASRESRQLST
jgi:diguanylate cyclase (GGDEF)-like protein